MLAARFRIFVYLVRLYSLQASGLGSLHTSLRRARMARSERGTSEDAGPSEPFEDDLVELAASSPSVGARTTHCVDGTVPRLAGLPTPASFRELVAP